MGERALVFIGDSKSLWVAGLTLDCSVSYRTVIIVMIVLIYCALLPFVNRKGLNLVDLAKQSHETTSTFHTTAAYVLILRIGCQ